MPTNTERLVKLETSFENLEEKVDEVKKGVDKNSGLLTNGITTRQQDMLKNIATLGRKLSKLGGKVGDIEEDGEERGSQVDELLKKINDQNKSQRKRLSTRDIIYMLLIGYMILNSLLGNPTSVRFKSPGGQEIELQSEAPTNE